MHSAGRSKNFWIPPENSNDSAVPSPISPAEPPTPTRATTSSNRPPQSVPNVHRLVQPSSSSASQSYFLRPQLPTRPTGRAGHEFNRRERKFEALFNAWTNEMTRLNEEHRRVTDNFLSEADSTKAMDDFNAKAQYVIARYNEEIEALQMSSSEPGSSQDENEEDDEVDEEEEDIRPSSRALPAFMKRDQHADPTGDVEDEDEDGTESEEIESEEEEPQIPETAIDDEEVEDGSDTDEENSVRNSEHSSHRVAGSTSGTDDSDHSARLSRRSGRSCQSSNVSTGSKGPKTPPPTEDDEDWRAAQRRRARERLTADEVASALPIRLRSGTLRGSPSPMSSVHRPPAMHLFETLSSSPASISSMHSSLANSRRPSRDVPTTRPSPIEIDPSQMTSRIEYLRRQNSTSSSDRSLSRNRPPSPVDQVKLFRDQFEGWKNAARSWSDEVRKKAQQQTEESRLRFEREQEEKHRRAQQLFIANQEKMLQQFSRNRAGSTGASGLPNGPAGPHVRNNSFVLPNPPIPTSASPTAQRGPMAPPPLSSTPTNRPLQHATSQTFQLASSQSPARPRFQGQNHQNSPIADNRHSTASSSGSDEVEVAVDDDEFDASTPGQKGTPPISIPNSTRGSFDAGHRRNNSQVYTGPPGQRNNFPQQLRNQSSTTFSSTSGTQSARSSGGWSGVSGASSNTTVTSSDTPSSRRGSMGEKTFVPPVGLHNDPRKTATNGGVVSASPPTQGHRWIQGSLDASGSSSHNSSSGISRAATLPVGFNPSSTPSSAIPPRTTAQQWASIASSSSPSAASSVQPGTSVGSSNSGMTSRPPPVSLNLGHSPGKTSWKMTGQPSPPIPLGTRPPNVATSILGPPKMRPETNTNGPTGFSPPGPLDNTPKVSPGLKTSASNADIFASSIASAALRSRASTSNFAQPSQPNVLESTSRSVSPAKPTFITPKSSISPAKVTPSESLVSEPESLAPVSPPPPEPTQKESKKAEKRRAKAKEEEQRRKEEEKKKEELRQQQENERLQREEAERKRLEEEEKKREEEERKKKEEEDRKQREEAEAQRKREEEVRKAEEAKRKREDEARRKKEEAEAKRLAEQDRIKQARFEDEKRREREEDEQRQREEALAKREEAVQRRLAELRQREREKRERSLRLREEQVRLQEEELKRLEQGLQQDSPVLSPAPLDSPESATGPKGKESIPRSDDSTPVPDVALPSPKAKAEGKKKRKRLLDEHRDVEARQERERQERENRLAEENAERERIAHQEELERIAAAERRAREQLEMERRKAAERAAAEEEERRAIIERKKAAERAAAEERAREQEALKAAAVAAAAERAEQEKRDAAFREREEEEKRRFEERRRQQQRRLEEQARHAAEERKQAQLRQQQQEEELRRVRQRREEEERRAQEARIREQNDRMTEMFQARERNSQASSNMPKRVADAWESYEERWKQLALHAQSGGMPLTFATIPWPTLGPPSGPEAITRNSVSNFLLSQWAPTQKSKRDRLRDALRKWHPDQFESRYLLWVPEGEERDHVKVGVGNVARSLNELWAAENSNGTL